MKNVNDDWRKMNLKSKRLEAKVIKFLGNEFQLKNLNTLTSSQIKLKTLI